MACKKHPYPLLSALIIAVSLCVSLAGCATVKQAPEPLPAAVAEPDLAELAARLDASWALLSADDAVSADKASAAFKTETPLFTAPEALPAGDRLARRYETRLGDLLADAERGFLAANGIETDFAFINAELIRAGLPSGPVTKADIERVLPFGQTICIAEMSGKQLIELFAEIGALPQGAGGFAQVSDGVKYTLSFDETGFGPSVSDILVGGEPVDVTRTYRVALNDFVAAGGNGYSFFLRDDVVKAVTSVSLAGAIADYCSEHADSLYMKAGGRITILGGITE